MLNADTHSYWVLCQCQALVLTGGPGLWEGGLGKADGDGGNKEAEAEISVRRTSHAKRAGRTLVNFFKKDVSEGWKALKTGDWNTNKLKELKEMF